MDKNWEIVADCHIAEKSGNQVVIIAKVNKNIAGFEDTVHLLRTAPEMLEYLKEILKPDFKFDIEKVRSIIQKSNKVLDDDKEIKTANMNKQTADKSSVLIVSELLFQKNGTAP